MLRKGGTDVVAVKTLVVASKGAPQLFLRQWTQQWTIIGTLVVTDQDVLPVKLQATPDVPACLLLSPVEVGATGFGDLVVVVMPQTLETGSLYLWTETLLQHVTFDRMLVFESPLATVYAIDREFQDDQPVLRSLATSTARAATTEVQIPTLESPQFVDGLVASLLTQGELRKLNVRAVLSLRHATTGPLEAAQSFGVVVPMLGLSWPPPTPLLAVMPSLIEDDENTLYT